jgi:sugar/nucleoside kinase (ribokinase family)
MTRPLIFGPAYRDVLVTTPAALAPVLVDRSLPARECVPAADGAITVLGPTGDRLRFPLAPADARFATRCLLAEPVLDTEIVNGDFPVARVAELPGGMGAGYAKALGGVLRAPFGDDAVGRAVLTELAGYGVDVVPALLPECPSDTSLVLLSDRGDKLAIGVRQAMVRWRVSDDDRALLASASALVCCGAPNALLAELLAWQPGIPVMVAPALRNVRDAVVPLASLAAGIHYLTMNALEWETLADRDAVRAAVPVISVTDGPRGSRILFRDGEVAIPAAPAPPAANVNRAGETYGAAIFRRLLAERPDFPQESIDAAFARAIGAHASALAARQLALEGFAFPA